MKIRKTVIIIILLCYLMTGCSAVNKASEDPIINQFKEVPVLQMKPGTEWHFVTCSDAYQTEVGVDPKAWGTEGDDYLRQLIIKYKLDVPEIRMESDHLIEALILFVKLYLLNQIRR